MSDLTNLTQILEAAGLKVLDGKLQGLVDSTNPGWQKTILALIADAVDKHGLDGIALATQAIESLTAGKSPDLNWADLGVASDLLAQMENAEADQNTAAHAYLLQVSAVLGTVLSGILKSVL